MPITVSSKNGIKTNLLVYFFLLLLSLLLFLPVLHKYFASDDFSVLYRVAYRRLFFVSGFFRPLSDISLYGSYRAGGFNPFYFNLVNVFLHASCAFLLYRFCLQNVFMISGNIQIFAVCTAVLFLIYPFHNEAVIWAIGRGILLSGFFGFLALLVAFMQIGTLQKCLLSGACYFIGLCGYETILPLPFIVLLLLYVKNRSVKRLWPFAGSYLAVVVLSIITRVFISGSVTGSYAGKIFSLRAGMYAVQFVKTTGRLLLPPSQSSLLLGGCFIVLVAGIAYAGIIIVPKKDNHAKTFTCLSTITFFSMILPLMFGINTKTYEGDRIFYFTSFFLCLWVVFLVSLVQNKKIKYGIGLVVTAYFLFFFCQSVLTWKNSGRLVTNIISSIRSMEHKGGNIYLLNMPEEYNGAPVFRNGLHEALLINHIDTSGILVVNYISTEYMLKSTALIYPLYRQSQVFIYPNAVVTSGRIIARIHPDINAHDSAFIALRKTDKVFYWNKASFVLLSNNISPPLPQRIILR